MKDVEFQIIDIGYKPPLKKKILVVDDEVSIQTVLFDSLSGEYDVYPAHTGKEGVTKAGHLLPHLILMDMILPDITGYEAVRLLGADPTTRKIPVLVVTAKDFDPSTVDVIRMESNVAGFVSKPFRIKELREVIKKTLEAPPHP